MRKYNLIFKGYWRYNNRKGIPSVSGIYLVYRCTYNPIKKKVLLKEILYIGQADNLNKRHEKHEKEDEFLNECKGNEVLCYAIAEVKKENLNIVENALIFAQKPRLNDVYKDKFNYESSEFHLEGRCALMKYSDFSIENK